MRHKADQAAETGALLVIAACGHAQRGKTGRTICGIVLALCAMLILPVAVQAEDRPKTALQDHRPGIWSLPPDRGESRWLVIHGLAQSAQSGVYHIEVLRRATGDPVWKIGRLANHMAITEAALARSVVAPLKKGAVYPESFDDAYRKWQAQNDGAGGTVCQTEVLQCLPGR